MIAEPDSRPRLTERRILCGSLVILLLLLFVGAVVGLVTWYKAQQVLVEVEELWKAKLIQCQAGRMASENRLVTMASKIGCLFEENSAYHQAARRGLVDATKRTDRGGQVATPANSTAQGTLAQLTNVELDMGNVSISNGSLAAVQQMYESGVRLFIGFTDSDDLLSVLRWARQHAPDAVFVSPSATATDLAAGPAGPLLLSLSDAALAAALLCLFRQQGVHYLIPVVADSTYGRSLAEEVRRAALLDGYSMKLLPLTLYSSSSIWDRSNRQALVRNLRKTLSIVPRRGSAAFLFIAGGAEMQILLEDAGWDSELASVPWFGTDSIALRRDFLATEAARQAAIRVNLTAVIYTGTDAAGGADQWEVLQHLEDLTQPPQPAAPNILRAYEGAALLAELGKLVLGHGDTGAALGALRTVTRAGVTGASAMEDGSRRAGGHFAVASVVARSTPRRQLLTDSSSDAVWVVTGQVRLTADPQRGVYLSRAVYSAAGSAQHLVRHRDVAAMYAAAGGCQGDTLQLSVAEPAVLSAVDNQLQLQQIPDRLLVPAGQPVRVELHCARSGSGLLHLTVRCPAVQLPDSDTVFCLADTYRLRERHNVNSSGADGGLRWRHQRHLFRCRAASAVCLDHTCDEHSSCVNALTDEIGTWLEEGG